MEDEKCMPTPPKRVGREFVRQYYTIMNKSPENLHCFYNEEASFIHDDVDPTERRTVIAEGKMAIRDIMLERSPNFKHTSTKIHTVETIETLDNGLLIQINGEISYNEQPMRLFSQSIILIPKSPFQYFVQNDIFRFYDYEMDISAPIEDHTNVNTRLYNVMQQYQNEDWGTQCEEYIEPYDEHIVRQNLPREPHRIHDNVKLETSDSGMSSDAEKAIMDIQSLNLKSMLQDSKIITKETVYKRGPPTPNYPKNEQITNIDATATTTPENHTQLFRDSCILTIGNVVNPNIELFDEDATNLENATTSTQFAPSDSDKTQENIDTVNVLKNDENNQGKMKYRKRKNKQKIRNEIQKEKLSDECTEKIKVDPLSTSKMATKNCVSSETSTNSLDISPIDKTSTESLTTLIKDQNLTESFEKSVPNTIPSETKTYADLAKEASKEEWIDELSVRRDTRNKSRPSLTRRNSKIEKTTPPNDLIFTSRSSPKNDQTQVFIGNIPHTATEEGIRKMFSRYGRITRFRLHSNNRKDWLPYYAFITYDSIQSAKNCLMKKSTLYWPENNLDGQKLNVNGDPSIDIWEESEIRRLSDGPTNRSRELRQFSKSFVLGSKEGNNKRSPDNDIVKSERRSKGSNRS